MASRSYILVATVLLSSFVPICKSDPWTPNYPWFSSNATRAAEHGYTPTLITHTVNNVDDTFVAMGFKDGLLTPLLFTTNRNSAPYGYQSFACKNFSYSGFSLVVTGDYVNRNMWASWSESGINSIVKFNLANFTSTSTVMTDSLYDLVYKSDTLYGLTENSAGTGFAIRPISVASGAPAGLPVPAYLTMSPSDPLLRTNCVQIPVDMFFVFPDTGKLGLVCLKQTGPSTFAYALYTITIGTPCTWVETMMPLINDNTYGVVGIPGNRIVAISENITAVESFVTTISSTTGALVGVVSASGDPVAAHAFYSNFSGHVNFLTLDENDQYVGGFLNTATLTVSQWETNIDVDANLVLASEQIFANLGGPALHAYTTGTTNTLTLNSSSWLVCANDLSIELVHRDYTTSEYPITWNKAAYLTGSPITLTLPSVPAEHFGIYTVYMNFAGGASAFRTPFFEVCLEANQTTTHTWGFLPEGTNGTNLRPYAISRNQGDFETRRMSPHIHGFTKTYDYQPGSLAFDRTNLRFYAVNSSNTLFIRDMLLESQTECLLPANSMILLMTFTWGKLLAIGYPDATITPLQLMEIDVSSGSCGTITSVKILTGYEWAVASTFSGSTDNTVSLIASQSNLGDPPYYWLKISLAASIPASTVTPKQLASTTILAAAMGLTANDYYVFEQTTTGPLYIGLLDTTTPEPLYNSPYELEIWEFHTELEPVSTPFIDRTSKKLHWLGGANDVFPANATELAVYTADMSTFMYTEYNVPDNFVLVSDMIYAILANATPDPGTAAGMNHITFANHSYVIQTNDTTVIFRAQQYPNGTEDTVKDCGLQWNNSYYLAYNFSFDTPLSPYIYSPEIFGDDIGCFDILISWVADKPMDKNHTTNPIDWCVEPTPTVTPSLTLSDTASVDYPEFIIDSSIVNQIFQLHFTSAPDTNPYPMNKIRLASSPACTSSYPGVVTADVSWTAINQSVWFTAPNVTGTAYLCWAPGPPSTGWVSLGPVPIYKAPTWDAPSAIETQNIYFQGKSVPITANGSCQYEGRVNYTFKIFKDPLCTLPATAFAASSWPSGCVVNNTVLAGTAGTYYVCFTSSNGAWWWVIDPQPLTVVGLPSYMAPAMVATFNTSVQFVGLQGDPNFRYIIEDGVSNCSSPTPKLGTAMTTWGPSSQVTYVTPTTSRRWGLYTVCWSSDNGAHYSPLTPKTRNRYLYRCQTEKAPSVYCWCMNDNSCGRVHADCRNYYFEPWLSYAVPDNVNDWADIRLQWDQTSYDGVLEYKVSYAGGPP